MKNRRHESCWLRSGAICGLFAFLALMNQQAAGSVDTSGFAKKMTISVNADVIANVTAKLSENEDISNFPVLVRLDASKVDYTDFLQPNGADMLFVLGEGKSAVALPHEVQLWNTSGESLVWVKVPELVSGLEFDLYYSSLQPVANDPEDVWSEYVSVLHYEEPVGANLANVADRAKDATARGSGCVMVEGVLGGARTTLPDWCGIELATTPSGFGISSELTFSTWMIHKGDYYYDHIIFSGDSFDGRGDNGGFAVQVDDRNKSAFMGVASGNWNDRAILNFGSLDSSLDWNSGWTFCAVTFKDENDDLHDYSAVTVTGMMGGEYIVSSSGWGDMITPKDSGNTGKKIMLGSTSAIGTDQWHGSFDESRLRKCVSSEAWLTAERLSVEANLMTCGTVDTLIPCSIVFADGAAVVRNADGTVTVTAALTSGSGAAATMQAVFNGSVFLDMATDVPPGETVVKTFAADALPADTIWTASVLAFDANGAVRQTFVEGTFMTGVVTVTPLVTSADEETLTSGSFKLSRPASAAQHPFDVELAFGGTAVNGQTYARIPATVTFPVGVSELTLEVRALRDCFVDSDSTAVFSVAPGQYGTDGSSATVTIANFRDARIAHFAKTISLTLKPDIDAFTEGKTLTDFPVLVRLQAGVNGFDPNDVLRADHGDIAIFSADMEPLPYEIESWNQNGETRVWVKVPTLTPELQLQVYYGSTEAVANNPEDVWTGTGYLGVWHLAESGAGAVYRDSTVNAMNGELVNGRILITDPANTVFQSARQWVTASIWVKPAELATWQWIVTTGSSEGDGAWGLQFTNEDKIRFWDDRGQLPLLDPGTLTAGQWVRFDFVYNSTTYILYVNGKATQTLTGQNWPNGQYKVTNKLAIGGFIDTTKNDNLSSADFHELRFTDRALPAEWLKATYAFEAADCFNASDARDMPAAGTVLVDAARTAVVDGAASVVLPFKRGTGTVYALITKPDGTVEKREIASGVTGPLDLCLPYADLGPAGWYDVCVRAEGAGGDYSQNSATVHVCSAPVGVVRGLDANRTSEQPGTFVIELAGGVTLDEPLSVDYLIDGVAESVTIPAGVNRVQVSVLPDAGSSAQTMNLTLACRNSPVAVGKGAASVAITSGSVKPRVYRLVVNNYTGGEVTDFPALVRLKEGVDGFAHADVRDWAGLSDVVFKLSDGTVLTHQVDNVNPSGETDVWVKIPTLAWGEAIFMEVGGAMSAGNVPHETWNGQLIVWHVNYGREGSPEGRGFYANAAQANVQTMRAYDSGNILEAEGIVGRARQISNGAYDVSDGHYIEMGANELMMGLGDNFTASVWFKYIAGQRPGDDRIFSFKSGGEWNANGWEILLNRDNEYIIEIRGDEGYTFKQRVFPDGANTGDWYHLVTVFDGTDMSVYVNGVLSNGEVIGSDTAIKAASQSTTRPLTIGCNVSKHNYNTFKGTLDEIRLAPGSISAARVKADYETVANSDFFRMRSYSPGLSVIIR